MSQTFKTHVKREMGKSCAVSLASCFRLACKAFVNYFLAADSTNKGDRKQNFVSNSSGLTYFELSEQQLKVCNALIAQRIHVGARKYATIKLSCCARQVIKCI